MSAPVAVAPTPQLAKKWIVAVRPAGGVGTYTEVKALTQVQMTINYTEQDQTTYDDGMWSGGQFVTQLAWVVTGTAMRKLYAGAEDPGQQLIREAAVPIGNAQPRQLEVQVYDRFGGIEAYDGTVTVQWAPQGGVPTDLETAQFTMAGVGARNDITNPVTPPPPRGAAAPGNVYPVEPTITASDAINAARLQALGYIALPQTAWTTGQSITVNGFAFHWDGAAWAAGVTP